MNLGGKMGITDKVLRKFKEIYTKRDMLKGTYLLLSFMFVVLYFASVFSGSAELYLFSLLDLFLVFVFYVFDKFRSRYLTSIFLVSFFTFLIGGLFVSFLRGGDWINPYYAWVGIHSTFTKPIGINTINCLILALIALLAADVFYNKVSRTVAPYYDHDSKETPIFVTTNTARILSFLVFCVMFVPSIFGLISMAIYSRLNGYISLYTSYPGLPTLVVRAQQILELSFFIFLATNPKKKFSIHIILVYIIYSLVSLVIGQRANFVTTILTIVFYVLYRNFLESEPAKKWITKKVLAASVVLVPIGLSFLLYWGSLRENPGFNLSIGDFFVSFQTSLTNFFFEQGYSSNIISYAQQFADRLPKTNLNYSFGRVIEFMKHNFISNIFFDFPVYKGNSLGAALHNNSFAHTITYLVRPRDYFNGFGSGTSYIAELYIDFKWLGIFVYNFLLGLMFAIFQKVKVWNPYVFGLFMFVLKDILLLPRMSASDWIVKGFNFTIILIMVILMTLNKVIDRRYPNIFSKLKIKNLINYNMFLDDIGKEETVRHDENNSLYTNL